MVEPLTEALPKTALLQVKRARLGLPAVPKPARKLIQLAAAPGMKRPGPANHKAGASEPQRVSKPASELFHRSLTRHKANHTGLESFALCCMTFRIILIYGLKIPRRHSRGRTKDVLTSCVDGALARGGTKRHPWVGLLQHRR